MKPSGYELPEFTSCQYMTAGGIKVNRQVERIATNGACDEILEAIEECPGALFSSSYEYPGRYTRWDIGFTSPSLELRCWQRRFRLQALNQNGWQLLAAFAPWLEASGLVTGQVFDGYSLEGEVLPGEDSFPEEQRSQQPTVFSIVRQLYSLMASSRDKFLGLYGAFGYDLVFQFETINLQHQRSPRQADLVLYLPDKLVVVDHMRGHAYKINYSFEIDIPIPVEMPLLRREDRPESREVHRPHLPGRYARVVEKALQAFARGDLFEVVASQTLVADCSLRPAQVFQELKRINPSPYGFIINLGDEFLVGASPEMYVRVEGKRVETCPISGTIKRGKDSLEDASQILKLLNSTKDEAELTMCTDVDRNDKSRICLPGSVRVLGRRQIEMYSHLIHTVDHVEGLLRPGYDALDAFLSHMWAVTVTGAPKKAAIQWLEDHEDSPRQWYGGAVGFFTFNGNLNTGLTLRTIRLRDGKAEVRVGATLLYDSIPAEEETETYLKAAALLQSIQPGHHQVKPDKKCAVAYPPTIRVLVVDHEDSFVHTLANYFGQAGVAVEVLRSPLARERLRRGSPYNLVVLSPGPGRPSDFKLQETIQLVLDRGIPLFGVCLGLQGIVEYFGGELGQLDHPQHGKRSLISVTARTSLWEGLPDDFQVGRYHSLYARKVPDCLQVTSLSEDGVVMAVEHKHLPVIAVQFHPESLMTQQDNQGLRLIENLIHHYLNTENGMAAGAMLP